MSLVASQVEHLDRTCAIFLDAGESRGLFADRMCVMEPTESQE